MWHHCNTSHFNITKVLPLFSFFSHCKLVQRLRVDDCNICNRRFSSKPRYVTKTLLLSLCQCVTWVDVLNFDRFIFPATCWTGHHKAVMCLVSLLDPSVGEHSASLFKADVCHYVLLKVVFLLCFFLTHKVLINSCVMFCCFHLNNAVVCYKTIMMILKGYVQVLSARLGVQMASTMFKFSAWRGINKGRTGVSMPPAWRRMPT